MKKEREELLALFKEKALKQGEVTLASGKRSSYYIDAKMVSLSAKGLYLIAKIILDMLEDCAGVRAVGGMTVGADPIVSAVAMLSCQNNGRELDGLIVRKEPKRWGMRRLLEGPELAKGAEVAVIDDVVTTGASTLKAVEELRKEGYVVNRAIALVDRMEGGDENLRKAGCELRAIFSYREILG